MNAARRFEDDLLSSLRAVIIEGHPETAVYRGGGPGRMLPIAQVLADWATSKGQAICREHPKVNHARRLAMQSRDRKAWAESHEERIIRTRYELEDLAAQWDEEDRAAAAAKERAA